jgi:hypothetical protein
MSATIFIMLVRNSDHHQRCLAWSWALVLMKQWLIACD